MRGFCTFPTQPLGETVRSPHSRLGERYVPRATNESTALPNVPIPRGGIHLSPHGETEHSLTGQRQLIIVKRSDPSRGFLRFPARGNVAFPEWFMQVYHFKAVRSLMGFRRVPLTGKRCVPLACYGDIPLKNIRSRSGSPIKFKFVQHHKKPCSKSAYQLQNII